MAADIVFKQGDTAPIIKETFLNAGNENYNIEGSSVVFQMRALTSSTPVKLTGTVAIISGSKGEVTYSPSAKDTEVPGSYMANWLVTFSSGARMTFPTTGYLSVEIQESIEATSEKQLVSLQLAKSHIGIPPNDHTNDAALLRCIESVGVLIENIVGPIRLIQREEWHDGGNYFIQLRKRPSTAFGTTPVMRLIAAVEYRGPIMYNLSVIQNPSYGSIYSCMLDSIQGTVTRRTSGGGVMAFPAQSQAVQVWYESGQEVVPPNIQEATLEAIKLNFSSAQATGPGAFARSEDETGPPMGFFLSRRVLEMIQPMRKHPSIY
jgi:hypothetical protein